LSAFCVAFGFPAGAPSVRRDIENGRFRPSSCGGPLALRGNLHAQEPGFSNLAPLSRFRCSRLGAGCPRWRFHAIAVSHLPNALAAAMLGLQLPLVSQSIDPVGEPKQAALRASHTCRCRHATILRGLDPEHGDRSLRQWDVIRHCTFDHLHCLQIGELTSPFLWPGHPSASQPDRANPCLSAGALISY
jgi:hypothetical protein